MLLVNELITVAPLNCNSKKIVHLLECLKYNNPYVDKAQTKLRISLNNYRSVNKSFKTNKRVTQ